MRFKNYFERLAQEDKKKVAQKKKDDDDRAHNRPVDAPAPASSKSKSIWDNLTSTPCFLPAVTDNDTCDEIYSRPPVNGEACSAFLSDDSFRHRAFVSKSANT